MLEVYRHQLRWLFLLAPMLMALGAGGQSPPVTTISERLCSHRPGTEKKDAVLSFLQTALSAGDGVMSREIVDQAKFKDGLSKIVDGTVECFNASVWAKA